MGRKSERKFEGMAVGYVCAAVAITILLIWDIVRKTKRGSACCGEHEESVKRLRAGDRNPTHYPYRYLVEIDGMVCGNCARTVENCFHQSGGISASVDLGTKKAKVLSKQALRKEDIIALLRDTTYTVMEFQEEKG